MDNKLFQDLLESVKEAGAILRGEREAGRRAGFSNSEKASGALGNVERMLARRESTSATRLTELVFREMTGIEADELRGLLIGHGEMPKRDGARHLQGQLAKLLDCRLEEASALLGASASRFSRNDHLSRNMLDRAYAVLDIYVRVAMVLGPRGATDWFVKPNPVLDGEAPRQLLKTSYGRRLVRDLVDALLAGFYGGGPNLGTSM